MAWIDDVLSELADTPASGYHRGSPAATEPVALTALAWLAHDRPAQAAASLDWLNEHQAASGSLGVTAAQETPGWPTSLAILAWKKSETSPTPSLPHSLTPASTLHRDQIARAVSWTLSIAGKPLEKRTDLGHDTTLLGWPWVESTHSWVEPTAFAVLALKATGYSQHPRTREAVKLLIDRLFPDGGCNYGNTFVLGEMLRPHIQPSGIALLALAGESDPSGRIDRTVRLLQDTLSAETTTSSLCFALLGLAAHDREPKAASQCLAAATARTFKRGRSPYKLALLALAAKGSEKPLFAASQELASV